MKKLNIFSSFEKGLKIIESCETKEQCKGARRWTNLFKKRYKDKLLTNQLENTLNRKWQKD